MSKQYKSGIYCLYCKDTNKYYIGKSVDISTRKYQHFFALKNNLHNNIELQNDFNKYGESSFTFKELSTCPQDALNHLEHYWISKYDSIKNGYNKNNASTKLDIHKSDDVEMDFIDLNNPHEKFYKMYLNSIEKDENCELQVNKIKKIIDLLHNEDVDIDFLIECLCENNIELFSIIDSKNKHYVDNGLSEYEESIDADLAKEFINENINVYVKCKINLIRSEKLKIQEYNLDLIKRIKLSEEISKNFQNEIIKKSLNFFEFYESKSFNDIKLIMEEKNELYNEFNNAIKQINMLNEKIINI